MCVTYQIHTKTTRYFFNWPFCYRTGKNPKSSTPSFSQHCLKVHSCPQNIPKMARNWENKDDKRHAFCLEKMQKWKDFQFSQIYCYLKLLMCLLIALSCPFVHGCTQFPECQASGRHWIYSCSINELMTQSLPTTTFDFGSHHGPQISHEHNELKGLGWVPNGCATEYRFCKNITGFIGEKENLWLTEFESPQ